ncbi:MAG: 16S rRNA (adenine(1518)-N(6)/adenine(1519)-N(6))-dimethyltransferase RsmA [Ignavibacterium sp.]|nr:MAG: 16S rRNA (adenine(1518)-N(6)/adenine(1519)-N(6))-dimethyltransferase RsmA [Ignavibacterium sp.]
MQKVKPLKRFGQNYLYDKNIIKKIIREIDPKPDDTIVEIGPGRGALTEQIYGKANNFVAVELDKRVIEDLSSKFPDLELIQSDFLKIDINLLLRSDKEKIRIIGNIPYNITSPIIFKTIKNSEIIDDAVLMVQLEVAKRMTSQKGTKDYGILAVLLQYFSETNLCFKVSPNAFYPKPKVTSAVVHIKLKRLKISEREQQTFINIVKASFGNRRKKLKNSLSNSIFKDINFSGADIDLSLRAEQLDVNDFIQLAKYTQDQLNQSDSAS